MNSKEFKQTSAVELDGTLQLDNSGSVAFVDGLVELLKCFVEISNISLVVLLVVQLHNLAANRGLQSAIIIGEIRQREGLKSTDVRLPSKPYGIS